MILKHKKINKSKEVTGWEDKEKVFEEGRETWVRERVRQRMSLKEQPP
jgi:hypothetical protein